MVFVAVGVEATMLARAARALAERFRRSELAPTLAESTTGY